MTQAQTFHTVDVCIAGGGPAGMLLGLLLAKQGIKTLVLEQHPDFFREYRGEVLMPRFARLFTQLNLLDFIQQFPHTKIENFEIRTGQHEKGHAISIGQISSEFPYAVWMPQPIFLDALHQKAKTFPQFDLWFGASATELIQDDQKTIGVRVHQGENTIDVHAKIVVGADGRTSRLQRLGHFELALDEYKFDLIWFSLPRPQNAENTVQLLLTPSGRYIIAPKYPDLIQCGFVTEPGEFAKLRAQGVNAFKKILKEGPEVFQQFANELQDFKPFHPLQARIARVSKWAKDGLLLIGDAAHTCSPAGAIGVSIALETATIAADVILRALQKNDFSATMLKEVQQIREPEITEVQAFQSRLGHFLISRSTVPAWLLPWLIKGAMRLQIFQKTMRRVVVGEPISINPIFRFES